MSYQQKKERARNRAIEWQSDFQNNSYSWGEIAEWQGYFKSLARRYGLVHEFRENGII